MGRVLGYVRVSTLSQNLHSQIDKLNSVKVDKIYADTISGKSLDRPEFQKLLKDIQPGDTLVFTELSRISRSTSDLLELVKDLTERKIILKSLSEPWLDTSSGDSISQLILTILTAIVQLDREIIIERTKSGLAAARSRGRVGGRPRTNTTNLESAVELYKLNTMSISEICKKVNVSRSTFYAYLRKEKEKERIT